MKRLIRSIAAVVLAVLMLISPAFALTVEEALEILETSYLRELPDEVYEAETLDELFALLGDPYTYYMTQEEYEGFLDSVESTVDLVGIGVSIQYTPEGILVLETLKGGPAMEAGLRAGDLIIAVNGVGCVPANESHRQLILGEEGTIVTVTILRYGMVMNVSMKRAAVVVLNTETEVLDRRIGYISCASFGSDTGSLFLDGVETCNEAVDCWLVDVRGNSGGLTDAAVDAIGVFGGAGQHIYLRDGQGYLYYYDCDQGPITDHMTVVLVDGNTASAAEAFAAGMRDLRRGLTIGSRTYGKGTAQVVFDHETNPGLFQGDALKVTAYRFYSHGGITNDRVGVIPTLLVPDEMAYEVAMAICSGSRADPEHKWMLAVDGWHLELDYTAMSRDALSALLEAIPPSGILSVYEGGVEVILTPAEMAARMGVEHNSRWFRDVEESKFAAEINTLATYDIVHGDGEGNFFPGESLTRGEACALLGKALGLEGSSAQRFSDVDAGNSCAPYINAMAELGLVLGFGDGTFRPDLLVTQQEYVTLLARIACYLNIYAEVLADSGTEEEMKLVEEMGFSSWARESAFLLASLDGLKTTGDKPEPGAPILREEAAAGLYSVLVGTGVLPG